MTDAGRGRAAGGIVLATLGTGQFLMALDRSMGSWPDDELEGARIAGSGPPWRCWP